MRILLTNDDGVCAPGLWAAADALCEVGEVFVAAPDKEQSGVGASLTLRAPVRVTSIPAEGPAQGRLRSDGNGRYPVAAYSVEGTPGDSCILGLERLVGAVDLVVSGINAGSNLGWDVMMSGTVGGRAARPREGLSHHRHIGGSHCEPPFRLRRPFASGDGAAAGCPAFEPELLFERQRPQHAP